MEVTGKYAVKTVMKHVQEWDCGTKGGENLPHSATMLVNKPSMIINGELVDLYPLV
jgi:hypothetical protein